MVERTIFLLEFPFDSRDYKRFGIEVLKQNGFLVEIWDLSAILRYWVTQDRSSAARFNCEELTRFYDKSELYSRLSSLKANDFVLSHIIFRYETLGIYRALSGSSANYSVSMVNFLPTSKKSILENILNKCRKIFLLTPKNLWGYIFYKIPFQWFGVRPAALVLAGGTKCFVKRRPKTCDTEVLWCHTYDYDLYLEELSRPLEEKNMAVFLDQCLTSHRDFAFVKIKPFISAEKYYPLLDSFFDCVEKKLGFKVVIAVHPRSDDKYCLDHFKKNKCIKGQTAKLIRESMLVLAHDSTAVNLANLFYKPVIFLTSSQLDQTIEGVYIKKMAKLFVKRPIYIDRDTDNIDWHKEMMVDRGIYDYYKESYIKKSGSEDLPFWQIVANRLKKGF